MKFLLSLFMVPVFLLGYNTGNACGQMVPQWQDLHTGITQEAVYLPPPQSFYDGIRTAAFTITYTGYSAQAQQAFQFAADIWSSLLNSEVAIKVNTYFLPLSPGLLGITLPNGIKDFAGTPQPNVWYATALANSLAGVELNAGTFDFDLFLNSGINWFYGLDGNCPNGQYDLVSIALHEMCHGLGFVGLGKVNGSIGSFGLLEAADFAPIITSFPWPQLDTLPGIFDHYLVNANDSLLINFSNPSTALKSAFTSNQIYYDGEQAKLMNGGAMPRMYAPSTFALGSSLLHLNESTYPAGNINELMTPFSGTANAVHNPGPIVMGILMDIGWSVNYEVAVEDLTVSNQELHFFPNPVNAQLYLTGDHHQNGFFRLFDAFGNCLLTSDHLPSSINTESMATGVYILRWVSDEQQSTARFVKF